MCLLATSKKSMQKYLDRLAMLEIVFSGGEGLVKVQ